MTKSSKERQELIKAVWLLLVKDTPYRILGNQIGMSAWGILSKMSNANLDVLGTILMEKQS